MRRAARLASDPAARLAGSRAACRLLLLLVLLAALQVIYFYPQMPEVMASHFRGDGRADGFQSRSGCVAMYGVTLALVLAVFWGMPVLFSRVPASWFNLPRRDYWLAPERRRATLDLLAGRLQWFGVATACLLVAVFQLVFLANLEPRPRLEPAVMWALLGAYAGVSAAWLGSLLRTLRRAPPPGSMSG